MPNVNYRAIHTKSRWRKVGTHKSVASALDGPNGAASLFKGKVRINYRTHGQPLYVFVWEDGAMEGWAVREVAGNLEKRPVPVHLIHELEHTEGDNPRAIAQMFSQGL